MKSFAKNLVVCLVLTAALLLICDAVSACPMCKDSIETAKNDVHKAGSGSVSGGFTYSVYLMLAGLFTAIGMVSFNLISAIRRGN